MTGVGEGNRLGVPSAPSAESGEGYPGDGESSGPHATETVPSEGGPWGTSEERVEGLLKRLLGWDKGAPSQRGGWRGERREAEGPS